jgi:DNA-binding XRE family transcriptional regulator
MTGTPGWDDADYQRVKAVEYQDGSIVARFADGGEAVVDADRLLPERARGRVNWATLAFDPDDGYEFTVEADNGTVEIPSYRLRLLTDEEFNRHWDERASRPTPSLGARFRMLRVLHNWQSRDLARQVGVTPRTMSRFELGQHDLGSMKLESLLRAMGCSWKDLDEALDLQERELSRA